ncbi:Beta-xylanase [Venustampulla echinocandica]|uniref:Beta-xylanase n=1 Tax=Venustampulla echinocandica TaxID=2656787 RepID=A0A370TCV2_9HELO|nr:Beta-xylanase [Venustampulla echinocandica]RDL32090.1 Beta-xylanase [Venustampulla echinocandica]
MRFTSSVTMALGLGGMVSANPVLFNARQVAGLNAAMVARGREYIGTSLTIRNDQSETNIIGNKNEFGSITPENAMKWDATEPNQGQFTFGGADQVANYATQNGKHMRCHTLVWYSQLPGWVSNSNFNNATLINVMTNHINRVMGQYKGKCTHWDVVNEALNEDGTYRPNVFLSVIGEAYLPMSFRLAAAADPSAKLYYNDYNLEYAEAKSEGAARIVKLVQSYGVRIDGVGLQGHLVVSKTPTQDIATPSQEILEKSLRMYTDLGVDVAYTEVDIRMNMPASAQNLQEQAECYGRLTRACMAVERCVGITLWGVSDKYSWVPQTFNGEGAALLWNDNYQKKPAYDAMLKAIQG